MDTRRFISSRFELVRHLGRGATGDVFEAYDKAQGASVAIKVLRMMQPRAIERFKREFRALQDLQHRNLISFGELLEENGQLFFTMELVEGTSFMAYVRPSAEPIAYADTRVASSGEDGPSVIAAPPPRQGPVGELDEGRLRRSLIGLVRGLQALHAAGKVHRDVKPSNVLIAEDGRVVILDLGLLIDRDRDDSWTGAGIVGTPYYMAPEQAAGNDAGPAADWYSVGVVLYEALTGQLPYDGAPLKVLIDKQGIEALPPSSICSEVPRDLSELAMKLLALAPADRPSGAQILAAMGRLRSATQPPRVEGTTFTQGPPFVGRAVELQSLRELLERCVGRQEPVVVLVSGESGLGKTTMVNVFLKSLDPQITVLPGRCYERESVAYKAFDGIVGALARLLAHLPPVEAAALLPLHASLLTHVFPVLKRVPAFAGAPYETAQSLEHQELRARVFGALRELLARLAQRRQVVIAVDDLHWADDDSLALMAELLRAPGAPPVLVIATQRPTKSGESVPSQRLRATCEEMHEIELQPLSQAESRELADLLLEVHGVGGPVDTDNLSLEAAGHPLFIDELVRHAAGFGVTAGTVPHLDDALWARFERLEPKARHLLEVLALAGNPLHQETIMRAAEIAPEQFSRLVSVLRVSNFARTTGARGSDTIEPYHDRVRNAIVRGLDADQRVEIHRALALALEGSPHAAQESMLAFHWRSAGRPDLAAHHAAAAAAQAADALAFDHAARFYRLALELDHPDRPELLAALGDALANAGRGVEASAAYQQAAVATSADAVALDMRRRAAEQLLISGHISQGLELISTVLGALGMKLPRTPRGALSSLVLRRALLRVRGAGFREREASAVAATELMRVDLCFAIATGLANVDTIRGADFQTRHLLVALRAGEPTRVARALAIEGGFASTMSEGGRRRGRRLFAAVRKLLERTPSAHASALLTGAECIAAFQGGQWRRALELAREGERAIRDQRTGAAWQRDTVSFFLLYSLFYLGELRELVAQTPALLRSANERGDLYAATNLRNGLCNMAWLVVDDVEQALRHLEEGERQWTHEGFHVQHYHHLLGRVNAYLYAGAGSTGYQLMHDRWKDLERSLLLRVEAVRVEAWHMRARVALVMASVEPDARSAYLSEARAFARRLQRCRVPWAKGFGDLAAGAIANLDGDTPGAAGLVERAAAQFEAAEMSVFAAAAHWTLGRLRGGRDGDEQTADAERALRERGVVAPARFVGMLAPGFV